MGAIHDLETIESVGFEGSRTINLGFYENESIRLRVDGTLKAGVDPEQWYQSMVSDFEETADAIAAPLIRERAVEAIKYLESMPPRLQGEIIVLWMESKGFDPDALREMMRRGLTGAECLFAYEHMRTE